VSEAVIFLRYLLDDGTGVSVMNQWFSIFTFLVSVTHGH
jgi:hypothetical protein